MGGADIVKAVFISELAPERRTRDVVLLPVVAADLGAEQLSRDTRVLPRDVGVGVGEPNALPIPQRPFRNQVAEKNRLVLGQPVAGACLHRAKGTGNDRVAE